MDSDYSWSNHRPSSHEGRDKTPYTFRRWRLPENKIPVEVGGVGSSADGSLNGVRFIQSRNSSYDRNMLTYVRNLDKMQNTKMEKIFFIVLHKVYTFRSYFLLPHLHLYGSTGELPHFLVVVPAYREGCRGQGVLCLWLDLNDKL